MDPPEMYYCLDWNPGYGDLFNGENILISAGVCWYTVRSDWFGVMKLPENPDKVFMDSGGFQATSRWDIRYPYKPGAYFNLAEQVGADYVAGPDFACEPNLHHSTPRERMLKTVSLHAEAVRVYREGDWSFQFVPVLQGWTPADYSYCAKLFKDHDLDMGYMALGTVCKRRNVDIIHDVLSTCEDEFPDAEWHMFGLTKRAWKDRRLWGRFRSGDTAAWNWGEGTTEGKARKGREYVESVEQIRHRIREQSTLTA